MLLAKILIVRISSIRYVSGETTNIYFHSLQMQSLTSHLFILCSFYIFEDEISIY